MQALEISASEDQLGPFSTCSAGRFEPDAGTTTDHDNRLLEEFRFALNGDAGICGFHEAKLFAIRTGRLLLPAKKEIAATISFRAYNGVASTHVCVMTPITMSW